MDLLALNTLSNKKNHSQGKMKRHIIPFAQLALLFVIFTSGVVIGMETDVSVLPPEINKLILTKVLRLVLDEVEDNPQQLMSRKKLNLLSGFFAKHITGGTSECYESTNNIDYILKLMRVKTIGADPNTKSYKGNNVLHLLILEFVKTQYQGGDRGERCDFKFLQSKIKPLLKYGLNLNAQNEVGNTVAHQLIALYAQDQKNSLYHVEQLIAFLQKLGMSITMAKNKDGHTAYETGQILNNKREGIVFYTVETTLAIFLNQDKLNAIEAQQKTFSSQK